jgi:hypothetical protein
MSSRHIAHYRSVSNVIPRAMRLKNTSAGQTLLSRAHNRSKLEVIRVSSLVAGRVSLAKKIAVR